MYLKSFLKIKSLINDLFHIHLVVLVTYCAMSENESRPHDATTYIKQAGSLILVLTEFDHRI